MVRFVLSAVALVGVLATAHPVFADPVLATPCDHTQIAAPGTDQPASPTAPSSDAATPTGAGLGQGIIPVGFGWG